MDRELREYIEDLRGQRLIDEEGLDFQLELLPPASKDDIIRLESIIPCSLPQDIRDLLELTSGFVYTPIEALTFYNLEPFAHPPKPSVDGGDIITNEGPDHIFPCAMPIANHGDGDQWVIDLTAQSKNWGPIYFLAHDPPVIVYQSPNLRIFIDEVIEYGKELAGEIADVMEFEVHQVWSDSSTGMLAEECRNSDDMEIRKFARNLNGRWFIHDLRNAEIGDGFTWGRYGPHTKLARHGNLPIFAYEEPAEHQGFFTKLVKMLSG